MSVTARSAGSGGAGGHASDGEGSGRRSRRFIAAVTDLRQTKTDHRPMIVVLLPNRKSMILSRIDGRMWGA
jgi:hypothetical protein